jgi:hypothetical protein
VAVFKVTGDAEARTAAPIAQPTPSAEPAPAAPWDGAERRGPERAKNVARLPSTASRQAASSRVKPATSQTKTGTDDEWAEF